METGRLGDWIGIDLNICILQWLDFWRSIITFNKENREDDLDPNQSSIDVNSRKITIPNLVARQN
jgi:hypothetical protein